MTTKADRINAAYSKLRISGLTTSGSPEDLELALMTLENMMSELEFGRNICMDYNFEVDPDINSITNVAMPFWNMIDCNLAVRLATDFNKQMPISLTAQASQSLATASGISAADNARQLAPPDRMPIGDGTSLRYNKYQRFNRASKIPPADCQTNEVTVDDINDFTESFRAYLGDETIASYTIEADSGLTLVSSSNDDPLITYRIQAENAVTSGTWQQVKIIVTTSSGRVETRFIDFGVQPNLTVNQN